MPASRRRWILLALAASAALATIALATGASAHECTEDPQTQEQECHPTPVYPNWRPQYIPLFGVNDTRCETDECKANRQEAQRWRDEWDCRTEWCTWADFGTSVDDGSPNSVHAGMAGDHSLFEAAHSAQGHGTDEGNHDSHGGSVYADVCLGSDEGTSYAGQAGDCEKMRDTQVGVTILDHNPCGLPPVPGIPFPCIDEYHVIRPLHPKYRDEQQEESIEQINYDRRHWKTYICGYAGVGSQDRFCDMIRPEAS